MDSAAQFRRLTGDANPNRELTTRYSADQKAAGESLSGIAERLEIRTPRC